MTPEEVQKRIDAIEAEKGDDEEAHIMEDELREDVLLAIADGTCTDPAECARLALKTNEIEFQRWHA